MKVFVHPEKLSLEPIAIEAFSSLSVRTWNSSSALAAGPITRHHECVKLPARVVVGWVGLVGLVPLLFLYVVSGLVAPWWAVVSFVAVWCLLLLAALRSFRRRPLLALALPLLGLAWWYAVLWFGDVFLGWTA